MAAVGGTDERIIVGADVLRQPALASKCGTIDGAGMDVEANDPELSGYSVHSRPSTCRMFIRYLTHCTEPG
jgi:hypothetical protein